MYDDFTQVKIGELVVKVRRMTLGELRDAKCNLADGRDVLGDEAMAIVREHCWIGDTGTRLEPEMLSLSQLQKVMSAMVGIPDGHPISDFIGLLS